jgi:hypothetical protein
MGTANSFPVAYASKYLLVTIKMMWVSIKFCLEENDILVDLLTKFQPDPIWNLRDTIKTPLRCKLVLQTLYFA